MKAKRDLLTLGQLSGKEIEAILRLAKSLKKAQREGRKHHRLAGKTLAMIFEKPSLRTRVTFEVGMHQLGGHAVNLSPEDIQLGVRESVADIARNLSRWVDLILARTYDHDTLLELAENASVPVVNGLSDWSHPCQVLADCLTILEHRKRLRGQKIAFVGDGNNMVHSFLYATPKLGLDFRIACPRGYEPHPDAVAAGKRGGSGSVLVTRSVEEAVAGADVVYTDVWTSMGQEKEAAKRRRAFRGYRVDERVLALAKKDAIVMHCLPAHRGEEITSEVLDGPQSVVLDQAENRLHAQKAVLVWLSRA